MRAEWEVNSEVEVLLSIEPLTVRVPDVVMMRTAVAELNPARCAPPDVHLVIEVHSPGIRRRDRITTFAEYAEAGIQHYWMVDLDNPTSLLTHTSVDGHYETSGEYTGMATPIGSIVDVHLDLDRLTTSRAQRR